MRIPVMLMCILCMFAFMNAEWEAVGPFGGYLYSVVASPSDGNVVWVMSYSSPARIAQSTDGGASWSTIGSVTMGYCQDMAIDPSNANNLYAAGGNYAHRSTDGGVNWAYTYVTNSYFYSIAAHPTASGTLYGAGMKYDNALWDMAVHKSTNGGEDWTTSILYDGTGHSYARDVAVSASDPDIVYACGYGYETSTVPLLFKSTDGGSTFNDISSNSPTGVYFYTIGVHPTNPDIVYLGASSGIYRSTDGGTSWTYEYNATSNYNIMTNPADPDLVLSGAYYSIYKSTDAGDTWVNAGSGLEGYNWRGIAFNAFNTSEVYAGNRVGFFKTTDCGTNWFEYNNDLNLSSICSFATGSASPMLYTSCEEVGVFRTTNNGDDWVKLPTPLTCGNIGAFAVNPDNPNMVLGLEGAG
ncbi:MAG: hypothetical protein JSW49_02485 [candidate division WOR-3 bacterium]|nr:MAG: hypothetical protein JSW49_02485 [candidate division WOR-3 bacterium]